MDLLCNIIIFYIYILLYVFININKEEAAKRLERRGIYRFLYFRACGCCPRGGIWHPSGLADVQDGGKLLKIKVFSYNKTFITMLSPVGKAQSQKHRLSFA